MDMIETKKFQRNGVGEGEEVAGYCTLYERFACFVYVLYGFLGFLM